jgi:hypothetical protein
MRSEEEVRTLNAELQRLTGFIADCGGPLDDRDLLFACNVCDILSWVLGEITTEDFRQNYLYEERLRKLARRLEKKTGRALTDYQ